MRFNDTVKPGRPDFWLEPKAKRLVEIHIPGADIFDANTEPALKNPTENKWSTVEAVACFKQRIQFDEELADSLFSVEPPQGYSLERF